MMTMVEVDEFFETILARLRQHKKHLESRANEYKSKGLDLDGEHLESVAEGVMDAIVILRKYEEEIKRTCPATKSIKLEKLCYELVQTYKAKNHDYGDSFAEVRREIPNAILVRLSDKLNRLKTLYKLDGAGLVADEPIEDTLMDLALYALMEVIERGENADAEKAEY